MRLKLLSRKYSIYKQKRSFGKCEFCGKYKLCYEIKVIESPKDTYGVPAWCCKRDMGNEQYEYYFL